MPTPQQILTSTQIAVGPGGGLLVEAPDRQQVLAQSWNMPAATAPNTEFAFGSIAFPLTTNRGPVPRLALWCLNPSTVAGVELVVGAIDSAPVSGATVTPTFERFRCRPSNGPGGQGFICGFVPGGNTLRISGRTLSVASEGSAVTISMKAYVI